MVHFGKEKNSPMAQTALLSDPSFTGKDDRLKSLCRLVAVAQQVAGKRLERKKIGLSTASPNCRVTKRVQKF